MGAFHLVRIRFIPFSAFLNLGKIRFRFKGLMGYLTYFSICVLIFFVYLDKKRK